MSIKFIIVHSVALPAVYLRPQEIIPGALNTPLRLSDKSGPAAGNRDITVQAVASFYKEGAEITFSDSNKKHCLVYSHASLKYLQISYINAHMISLKTLGDSIAYSQLLFKLKSTR